MASIWGDGNAYGSSSAAFNPGSFGVPSGYAPNGRDGTPGGPRGGGVGVSPSLVQQLLNQSSGGGGQAASAPATVNNVAPNPIATEAANSLMARSKDPTMGVGAYDLGIQKIRANASKGIGADLASQAARGVAGTGLSEADARGRAQNQEAQVGSLTANFLAQREDKRDSLIGQAGNMGLGIASGQRDQQGINYGQYNADRDAAWREKQAQTTNLHNILSILSGSGMFGGSSLAV